MMKDVEKVYLMHVLCMCWVRLTCRCFILCVRASICLWHKGVIENDSVPSEDMLECKRKCT
eukprot:1607505-Amphidinium_carterae.1